MTRFIKLVLTVIIISIFIYNSNDIFNISFWDFWDIVKEYFHETDEKLWNQNHVNKSKNEQEFEISYYTKIINSIKNTKSDFNDYKRPYLIKLKSIKKENIESLVSIMEWVWIMKVNSEVHCIFLWSNKVNQCFSLNWQKCEWYKTCKLHIIENYWAQAVVQSNCKWVSKINIRWENYYSQFFCSENEKESVSTLDIDWDWKISPLNDWIIIQRYLYWGSGAKLDLSIVWKKCTRCDNEDIINYINIIFWDNILDIDWDWKIEALTDWLILYKWMEWKRWDDLVLWLSLKGKRNTWKDIEDYIKNVVVSY